jgi:hypothetical protein
MTIWQRIRTPLAILIAVAAFAGSSANVAHGRFAMGDFKAFYCSGAALLHGEDPYATNPMAQCESITAPSPLFVTKNNEVLPAPLPGYAVAAFVPLALLPFPVASLIWLALLCAALGGAISLLSKIGVARPDVLVVSLAIVTVAICFPVGELPPVALFGVALAAWAATERRPWLLGLGIALTFFEPQIGLASLVASIALGRRYAVPAGAAAVALGIVSVTAVGVTGNLEYFRVVLPAHLISELPSVLQYSLSWILYRLGVAPGPALLIGRISWIAMLGVTYWFARSRFAKTAPHAVFLAAPAFAVVGGPFLHLDHIALAIPAALWLSSVVQGSRWLRIGAVVALSLPVLYVFSITRLLPLVPFVAAWLGGACSGRAIVGLRTALVAVVALALIGSVTVATGTGSMHIPPVQPLPADLPQASWAAYIGKTFVMTAWSIWLVKAPVWLGILATAFALVAASRARAPLRQT